MEADTALRPVAAAWSPADATGDTGTDTEHQALLACCAELAACCEGPAEGFDEALAAFKAQVLAHLQAEAGRLDPADEAAFEDHEAEREEFESFAAEVASTAHFDRVELQRFAAFWTLGHIRAATRQARMARGASVADVAGGAAASSNSGDGRLTP
jgi:hypothetical protein